MNSQEQLVTNYYLRRPVTEVLVHMLQQVPNMNKEQLTQLDRRLQSIVQEGLWG